MIILEKVYKKIFESFPVPPPEQGGIIGIKNGVVCEYYHDASCDVTNSLVYVPDVLLLNKIIQDWEERQIQFAGIVHSHPIGQESLSSGDKEYIQLVFDSLPEHINKLFFPIVIPAQDMMFCYVAEKSEEKIVIEICECKIGSS